MTLTDLYMKRPTGGPASKMLPLGEWPAPNIKTPAQLTASRAARLSQIGKPKAGNRVQR